MAGAGAAERRDSVVQLWGQLQRAPGTNVGEKAGIGEHSVPGRSLVGGPSGRKGTPKGASELEGLWEVYMSGMKPETCGKMVTPLRPRKNIEKRSPDSVANFNGLGGGGGGPGNGDGDPTFDRGGRSTHWLNKALVSTDPAAHQYWQIVYAKRLDVNGDVLEEAGDFISKLMSMGLQPIVGITDRIDVHNKIKRILKLSFIIIDCPPINIL